MVNSEEWKSSKSDEKSSLPTMEQSNVHVYPDWAAMQVYYGPRVALPPYFNSAVASGHPPPPPYMWGPPQPMMPPYGVPYAAIYSPGGVYAHPALPYGSQPPGDGTPSTAATGEALAGTALSIDTPVKSSGDTDKGLVKKLKSFEGLAMSIGNGNSEKQEGVTENRSSRSGESEGSTDESDGSTDRAEEKRKRSREELPVAALNEKPETKALSLVGGKICSSGDKDLGVPVSTANGTGVIASPSVATTLELRNPGVNAKETPTAAVAPNAIISSESWLQNERELKRERRKQSNRESARRSRLRKQAETEELAKRVESLTSENIVFKAEINQLMENSEKLRRENANLMEKLKNTKPGPSEETVSSKAGVDKPLLINTENLLSRVNNSVGRSSEEGGGGDVYQKGTNSGAKLHQLLDTSPRADAVTAG